MQTTTYDRLQERVHHETLPNGLTVYLIPKPGFQKTFALFGTRYGSIDSHFQLDGREALKVPDGIAHFLEHKLFEEEDGDIFGRFAAHGADANAFTSNTLTAYLFSATRSVEANLSILLDFVQSVYLTDENVEKEKGIIEQELRMYAEMPFHKAHHNLLQALFQRHPIRIDIGGTVESIYEIDRQTLLDCYQTFYHPSNMSVVVVGDFDPEAVSRLIRDNQAGKVFGPPPGIRRFFDPEPDTVGQTRVEAKLAIAKPYCLIGFKETDPAAPGEAMVERTVVMDLLMDLLFGKGSDLYQQLNDAGLISDNFSKEYSCGPGYGFSLLGGETTDPERLEAAVRAGLDAAKAGGIEAADFERVRRKHLGRYLRYLDSPDNLSYGYLNLLFQGGDFFRLPELLGRVTLADAQARLAHHFDPARMAVSVVKPVS